ncbi:hypothetical protein Q31b_17570 [Novipirellula aureliae]|uniref:Uncharacterized protein n=1 Tax=Novipirellula aureliae TaxID=2527966 RepID=A0A5C6E925_9BACT|nr:hypothetical protein Q31b_17570 [Novipirellula aureliae]
MYVTFEYVAQASEYVAQASEYVAQASSLWSLEARGC